VLPILLPEVDRVLVHDTDVWLTHKGQKQKVMVAHFFLLTTNIDAPEECYRKPFLEMGSFGASEVSYQNNAELL